MVLCLYMHCDWSQKDSNAFHNIVSVHIYYILNICARPTDHKTQNDKSTSIFHAHILISLNFHLTFYEKPETISSFYC